MTLTTPMGTSASGWRRSATIYTEIRNSPFFAYGLNYYDVVRAKGARGEVLDIQEVVRRGGHRTLRVLFASEDEQSYEPILRGLDARRVNHEHASGRLYALDVVPEASYGDVLAYLTRLNEAGILEFEIACDEV